MATKKITELPFIVTVSGSSVFDNPSVNSVVPVVLYGTTNQITVENFSKFTNLYAAQTGSQNIFTENQWFNAIVSASTINVGTLGVGGNTTIAGTLGVTGNGTIGGNLAVAGRITAEEFYTEITTASVIYASGSTKFGDDTGDKHEFTGSINVSGSVIYNGVILTNIDANTIQRLQQATASLQVATASLHQATQSLQTFTSSQAERNLVLSIVTGSINQATASLQFHSASVNAQLLAIQQTTQSLQVATASLQFHSASVDSQLLAIQQTTQSLQVATASLQQFTASQDSRNFVISQYTSSTDAHIVGISTFTSSQYDTMARVYQATSSLQSTTASLNQFTASQDGRNFTLSQVTGSLIGITNGLMAFTAALDNTYATDAQLYQLYQATRSLELHSGSMVGVTNGLMAYTASLKGQAIVSSSTQVQNYDVFALNSNLYTSTGSLIGITNGLMAFTAALDNTYATDAQLYQLYQSTRSIELTTGSLIGITNGLMAFTAALDSTYATDAQLYQLYAETASIKAEIAGIEALTASFKAASIVSSSTQIQNYNVFAQTASANTFYGNQFITGGLNVNNGITGSVLGNLTGNATFATNTSNVALLKDNTDTTLYPVFSSTVAADTYASLKGHASGTLYYNGLTQQLIVSGGGLVVTGSVNVTGSMNLIGSSTFNSTTAKVMEVQSGTSTGGYVRFTYNGSSNSIGYIGNSNQLSGLGTVSDLELRADNNLTLTAAAAISTSTPSGSVYQVRSANGASGDHIFKSYNTQILKLDGGNNTATFADNIILASGKGIDFSATSNGSGTTSSELLNDYEEGTWTPTYTGTNLTVVTYGNQFGWYTKVGRLVTVTICLMTEDITVIGSENLKIGGLPFTSNSTAQASNALIIADSSRWASNPPIAGVITPNTTEVILYKDLGAVGAGTDPTTVKTSDLADATGNRNVVRGTLTYFV